MEHRLSTPGLIYEGAEEYRAGTIPVPAFCPGCGGVVDQWSVSMSVA
jgi:hypothetical protein